MLDDFSAVLFCCLWTDRVFEFFELSRFAQPRDRYDRKAYHRQPLRLAHCTQSSHGQKRWTVWFATTKILCLLRIVRVWYRYRCDQNDFNYEAVHWVRHQRSPGTGSHFHSDGLVAVLPGIPKRRLCDKSSRSLVWSMKLYVASLLPCDASPTSHSASASRARVFRN